MKATRIRSARLAHHPAAALIALLCFAFVGSESRDSVIAAEASLPTGPNIVLILADDLGYADLSCQGSPFYETPNIDRLAEEGMKLNAFYMCQNCAPTRAALISGQYAPRTGIYTVGTFKRGKAENRKMVPPANISQLPTEKITIAQMFKQAGYATGMFGKWHLGYGAKHHPLKRGFDEAIVSNGRHFQFKTQPKVEHADGAYLADFLTDKAVDFIDRHQKERFFLYLPHFAVHVPLQAKPELIKRYKNKKPARGHQDPVYAAMIQSVDESVGRVVAKLEELDLTENTLVIFTSDNGGLGGYKIPGTDKTKGTTNNFPLRGGKGMLYEGGVRVPFIARWPRVIKAGSATDQPAVHVDLYPTFAELAGVKPADDYLLDGQSIASLFNAPQNDMEHGPIYWHFPGYLESYIPEDIWRTTPVSVIRDGDFKLLQFFEDNRFELYNLKNDIAEEHDLAAERPEKTNELKAKLFAWRKQTNALMATPKQP